ncbi:atypical membrane-integrating protein (Mistic protein) [Oceanobacillus sp. FSL W7-1309]|uniref:atypical membrane-integrating protein (Mistic protein) n=1 Tax=Oceanobacillus sp. FSL W7-1309 TaxID=2954539 RepID=UPI0030FAFEFF
MKANDYETKRFDKALDEILDLFNNIEEDEPIIDFNNVVLELIEKANKKYGNEQVSEKINSVVGEMLSWLDLDNIDLGEPEKGGEE